jgi:hypothetical protein
MFQAIKHRGDLTHADTETIKSDTGFMRQEIDHEKHTRLLHSISSSQLPAQQYDFINRRQKGTGTWFMKSPEFEHWFSSPYGTPFVLERLELKRQSSRLLPSNTC